MSFFDIFSKTNPQAGMNPPVNPNLNHNPHDPSLTAQERQAALQKAAQQPQVSNNPGQNPAAYNAPGSSGASLDPNNPAKQNTPTLDDFSKLWETPTVDPKAPPNKAQFRYPKFDQSKLAERVQQLDFASAVPGDVLQKAASGDADAFREALNIVGRGAFQTGFSATDKLNSQLFDQFGRSVDERIPQQVKGIQNQAAVFAEMKGLDHPAVAPMLNSITNQMQQMYPDASPAEIANHSKNYLRTMAQVITGQIETDNSNASNNDNSARSGGRKTPSKAVFDFSQFDTEQ